EQASYHSSTDRSQRPSGTMGRRPRAAAASLLPFLLLLATDAFLQHAPVSTAICQAYRRVTAVGYNADLTNKRALSSMLPTYGHRRHTISDRRHSRSRSHATATSTFSAAGAAGAAAAGSRSWLGSSSAAPLSGRGRRRETATAAASAASSTTAAATEATTASTTASMSLSAQDLEITVALSPRDSTSTPPPPPRPTAGNYGSDFSSSSSSTSSRISNLAIKASHLDPNTGVRRTWTTLRSEQELFALGITLRSALRGAGEITSPPPPGSAPAVLQGYLRRLIDVPLATSIPALYEFLDAPPELTQEPVLLGEVRGLATVGGGR
ncbi:unnamed protein product, partial [Laminaria digitata]